MLSDNRKWHLRGLKNPKFPGGACPQNPLGWSERSSLLEKSFALSQHSPVTLTYSPATVILNENPVRRVHDLLCRNFNAHIAKNLSLDGDLLIRWHGIGSRTVSKTREYDLGVVEEFAPNVVIMQLGTNDLTTISAVETGSAIEDL